MTTFTVWKGQDSASKQPLRRRVLVLSPQVARGGDLTEAERFAYAVYTSRGALQDKVDELLFSVHRLTKRPVPRLLLSVERRTDYDQVLAEVLAGPSAGPSLRALFLLSPTRNVRQTSSPNPPTFGASHLIVFRHAPDGGQRWVSQMPHPGLLEVTVSASDATGLLLELAADIAFFHSFPLLGLAVGQGPQARADFSAKKATFAAAEGLGLLRAPSVALSKLSYLSLASTVLSPAGPAESEIHRLAALWSQLAATHGAGASSSVETPEQTAERLLGLHRQGGAISKRRLIAEIRRRGPGEYALCFVRRCPKPRSKAHEIIRQIVKRRTLRQNAWGLCRWSEASKLHDAADFISLLRFSRTDPPESP